MAHKLRQFSDWAQCPGWVNSAILTPCRWLPVHPDKQTFSGSFGMSQRCHQPPLARRDQDVAPRELARFAKYASSLSFTPLSGVPSNFVAMAAHVRASTRSPVESRMDHQDC